MIVQQIILELFFIITTYLQICKSAFFVNGHIYKHIDEVLRERTKLLVVIDHKQQVELIEVVSKQKHKTDGTSRTGSTNKTQRTDGTAITFRTGTNNRACAGGRTKTT